MANTSIFAAFERMWQHVVALAGGKADSGHTHDDMYYTEAEIDDMLQDVASESVINSKVNEHNTSALAHNDIRTLISDLSTAVNNFLDVDDTTTDQLSEVLTLINNNKGTLESLTTSKINVSDIIDNLTTNSTSKVLSAAQGVVLRGLIEALQSELDSHTGDTTKHITSDERTNWNAAKTNADTAQARADSAYSLAEGKVDSLSDLGITVTATELNYVDGVTSNIQTQFNGKADKSLTVNVTKSGTTFSADTTFSVISAAIDNNTAVYVKYNNTIYYPALKTAALITFRSHGSSSEDIINIMSSNVVTAAYSSLPVATEDSLGGIKSGGDISVGTDGIVTVNPSVVQEAYDLANTANTAATNALTAASDARTTANAALPKSGGTMTGVLTAQNNTSYTTKQARNIFLIAEGASMPSGSNGDICLVYAP